jgi:Tfp pilus assembly protein PilZ
MDRRSSLFEHREPIGPRRDGGVRPQVRAADGQRAPVAALRRDPEASGPVSEACASRVLYRSGTMMAVERRAAQRWGVELDVSVGADAHYFTAQARDLSCGGMYIETYRALGVGEELSIEFDLPAGRAVTKGVVTWVREAGDDRPPGYGVAFRDVSRFTRPLIESYCRNLAGIPSTRCLAG